MLAAINTLEEGMDSPESLIGASIDIRPSSNELLTLTFTSIFESSPDFDVYLLEDNNDSDNKYVLKCPRNTNDEKMKDQIYDKLSHQAKAFVTSMKKAMNPINHIGYRMGMEARVNGALVKTIQGLLMPYIEGEEVFSFAKSIDSPELLVSLVDSYVKKFELERNGITQIYDIDFAKNTLAKIQDGKVIVNRIDHESAAMIEYVTYTDGKTGNRMYIPTWPPSHNQRIIDPSLMYKAVSYSEEDPERTYTEEDKTISLTRFNGTNLYEGLFTLLEFIGVNNPYRNATYEPGKTAEFIASFITPYRLFFYGNIALEEFPLIYSDSFLVQIQNRLEQLDIYPNAEDIIDIYAYVKGWLDSYNENFILSDKPSMGSLPFIDLHELKNKINKMIRSSQAITAEA